MEPPVPCLRARTGDRSPIRAGKTCTLALISEFGEKHYFTSGAVGRLGEAETVYRASAAQALATAERPAPLGAPPGHPAPPWYLKWALVGSNPAKPLLFGDRSYKRVGTRRRSQRRTGKKGGLSSTCLLPLLPRAASFVHLAEVACFTTTVIHHHVRGDGDHGVARVERKCGRERQRIIIQKGAGPTSLFLP